MYIKLIICDKPFTICSLKLCLQSNNEFNQSKNNKIKRKTLAMRYIAVKHTQVQFSYLLCTDLRNLEYSIYDLHTFHTYLLYLEGI